MESKNTSLIIGMLIPFVMILLVAGSIYIPGIFIQPQYNFLYTVGPDSHGSYIVTNGALERRNGEATPPLFTYDVRSGESKEVTFEEAGTLKLDQQETSPDGFTIVYGSTWRGTSLFFFFSGRDYTTRYLKGRNVTKRLHLALGAEEVFQFIGWIIR